MPPTSGASGGSDTALILGAGDDDAGFEMGVKKDGKSSRAEGGDYCALSADKARADDFWLVKLELEKDCYSIVLVLPGDFWLVPALLLPAFAALFQVTFLYFVSIDHTNVFQEGRWLQPGSMHWYVYLLKGLSVLVTLLKCYGELQANMTLYIALTYGDIPDLRRMVGWCWWLLQYVVTIVVLVCAISLVGSAQSAITCIFKSLAVGLVVDLDNMLAAAIVTMTNIDFKINSDPKLDAQLPSTQIEQRNKHFRGKFAKWAFFMGFPMAIALSEIVFAVYHDSLPLTIVSMNGFVSNQFPPELRSDIVGPCCAPMLVQDKDPDPTTANYTVLFFSLIDQPRHLAPLLHWVALESQPEPTPPSSYQVMLGQDGDGNPGHESGVVPGEPVQANFWLKNHDFGAATYDALVKDMGLHQRVRPFAATLQVTSLESYGHAYKVYVAAQNQRTRALSPAPLASSLLITSVCPSNCENCETSKVCNKCTEGYYLLPPQVEKSAQISCVRCVDHCADCSQTARDLVHKKGKFDADEAAENGVPCDDGKCKEGFGMGNHSDCVSCGVSECATCEKNGTVAPGTCSTCRERFGLRVNHTTTIGNHTLGTHNVTTDHYTCDGCHENCLKCNLTIGCLECATGYGLHGAEDNRTCVQCEEGCDDCSNATSCETCKDSFVTSNGKCDKCPDNCKNCTVGGASECGECHEGYGVNAGVCNECKVEHCVECNNVAPSIQCTKCGPNYGLQNKNRSCAKCGEFCTQCDRSGECAVCEDGYAVHSVEVAKAGSETGAGTKKECWPCGDGCLRCATAGAGHCDTCLPGFKKSNSTHVSCISKIERAHTVPGVPNLEV